MKGGQLQRSCLHQLAHILAAELGNLGGDNSPAVALQRQATYTVLTSSQEAAGATRNKTSHEDVQSLQVLYHHRCCVLHVLFGCPACLQHVWPARCNCNISQAAYGRNNARSNHQIATTRITHVLASQRISARGSATRGSATDHIVHQMLVFAVAAHLVGVQVVIVLMVVLAGPQLLQWHQLCNQWVGVQLLPCDLFHHLCKQRT